MKHSNKSPCIMHFIAYMVPETFNCIKIHSRNDGPTEIALDTIMRCTNYWTQAALSMMQTWLLARQSGWLCHWLWLPQNINSSLFHRCRRSYFQVYSSYLQLYDSRPFQHENKHVNIQLVCAQLCNKLECEPMMYGGKFFHKLAYLWSSMCMRLSVYYAKTNRIDET